MKTEIRFHEGLKGSGVVVSVTHEDYRLIFDFGAPFRPNTNFYDGVVLHRKENALKDAIRLGETPVIDGIYPEKDLKMFDGSLFQNIQPYESSQIKNAVLISHLHLDHMSNIKYLHDDIPVHMHHHGAELLKALDDIQEGTPHQTIVPVEYGDKIHHGKLLITPYFSDHPCYGSAGYLIEAPDMTIYYSGDIRFHGLSQEKAFMEIEKLIDVDIDLLIVDGTSYSPTKFIHDPSKIEDLAKPGKEILEGMFLESGIYEDVRDQMSKTDKMGLFCIYHRDMQLIDALIRYAKEAGRTIAFETETAYIINTVMNRSVTFYHPDCSCDQKILEKVRSLNQEISFDDINHNKDKYLVQLSYKNLMNLHSLDAKGGVFFHLFGEPFGKGNKATRILDTMLKKAEVRYVGYSNVYSFNHAFPNHLSWMIDTISPKNVVCVHSNNPEKLNAMGSTHILPEQHVPYIYEDETLKKA